jgi:hypothetical protein
MALMSSEAGRLRGYSEAMRQSQVPEEYAVDFALEYAASLDETGLLGDEVERNPDQALRVLAEGLVRFEGEGELIGTLSEYHDMQDFIRTLERAHPELADRDHPMGYPVDTYSDTRIENLMNDIIEDDGAFAVARSFEEYSNYLRNSEVLESAYPPIEILRFPSDDDRQKYEADREDQLWQVANVYSVAWNSNLVPAVLSEQIRLQVDDSLRRGEHQLLVRIYDVVPAEQTDERG